MLHWVQDRIQRLPFRLAGREPVLPLGCRVLVIRGDLRDDLGQMAVVCGYAGTQVTISYRGPTGLIKSRRKRRTSLIRMEDGVEMVVNEEGWPIIRQVRNETEEEDDIGVVSEDGSGIAQ